MKMQKNIYAIMTAAMAASAVLVSSCNKDENAAAPVITFTGQGTTQDTFLYNAAITGSIVAEAGLKKVEIWGPNSVSVAKNWFKTDAEQTFAFEKPTIGSNPFDYNSGSPFYNEQGSKTNYVVKVEPSKTITGSWLANVVGTSSATKTIVDSFPFGKFTLVAYDENGNREGKDFWVVKQMPTYTPTPPPPCSALTDAMLLAGLASGEGMATMAWQSATDSIKAEGNYFFQRSSTPVQYGIVKVKKLDADSAVLTLLFLNAQGGTDSTGTATIYTATNKPSFFVITTAGVASSMGSGEGNQVGANGANVFVFIRSTSSGSPAIILDKAGSPQNVSVTNAAAVKFLSIAGIRQMAATMGQCTIN